jgi:hypothetical protein
MRQRSSKRAGRLALKGRVRRQPFPDEADYARVTLTGQTRSSSEAAIVDAFDVPCWRPVTVLSYSHRIGLGTDDLQRADIALIGAKGRRLTYRTVGRVRPM